MPKHFIAAFLVLIVCFTNNIAKQCENNSLSSPTAARGVVVRHNHDQFIKNLIDRIIAGAESIQALQDYVRQLQSTNVNIASIIDDNLLLHKTVFANRVDIAEILFSCGANANIVDRCFLSQTPLYAACSIEMIDCLIAHGAAVNFANRVGQTAVFTFLAMKAANLVRYLVLHCGADINFNDNVYGQTPLHMVAAAGDSEMICLILSLGADKTKVNLAGRTPIDSAYANSHESAAQLIERFVA